MGINEKREYFQRFHAELLTSDPSNYRLLNDFTATDAGKNLEGYLKYVAWKADTEGETRVYLVKDEQGSVALFFSIKCGLLYKKYQYDELEPDKQEFVRMLIDAMQTKDEDTLNRYSQSGMYSTEEVQELLVIAQTRMDLKLEERYLQDGAHTLKVDECYSAIEIQHFCRNTSYISDIQTGIPLGFGIFWEIIVPLVCEITAKVGCKHLYLFAADQTNREDVRKLVRYYKNELKFSDVENMTMIKPYYDTDCLGLVQSVSGLRYNREAVWEEFSDMYGGMY